jgi:hypothetical protein
MFVFVGPGFPLAALQKLFWRSTRWHMLRQIRGLEYLRAYHSVHGLLCCALTLERAAFSANNIADHPAWTVLVGT